MTTTDTPAARLRAAVDDALMSERAGLDGVAALQWQALGRLLASDGRYLALIEAAELLAQARAERELANGVAWKSAAEKASRAGRDLFAAADALHGGSDG